MAEGASSKPESRYHQIIQAIFFNHYASGTRAFEFARDDLVKASTDLGIAVPDNLGDIVYSFRYRSTLPEQIRATAPEGEEWIIRGAGDGRYRFARVTALRITPNPSLMHTKVPDATPGIIAKYALTDEQALLARVRYNRLIDIFTRVTCYSLQSHLRTRVAHIGQVETDEIYIGIAQRGAQYVFPVQAKGGTDRLGRVQVEQDNAMCAAKFPALICRPVAAQFIAAGSDALIALFELVMQGDELKIAAEKHYRMVPHSEVGDADLQGYQHLPFE